MKTTTKFIVIFLVAVTAAIFGFYFYKAPAGEKNVSGPNQSSQGAETQEQEAEVVLKIDTGQQSYEFEEKVKKETSVFELISQAASREGFVLDYEDSAVGVYIEGIYGIKNDAKSNKFWMFYINGQLSQVGASEYKLQGGEVVEWKYSGF